MHAFTTQRTGFPGADRTTTIVGLLAIGLGVVALGLYVFAESTLDTLTAEDGIVEYLTALGYLVAAVVFAGLALRIRRGRVWFLLLALGFFLIMGEEISWGQRLLGISTPSAVEQANVQDELTLHNLQGLQDNVRLLGVVLFFLLYLFLPFAAARDNRAIRIARRFHVPIPPVSCALLALIGLCFMIAPRVYGSVVFSLDEIGELYLAFAAAVFALAERRAALQTQSNLNPPAVSPAASARETA